MMDEKINQAVVKINQLAAECLGRIFSTRDDEALRQILQSLISSQDTVFSDSEKTAAAEAYAESRFELGSLGLVNHIAEWTPAQRGLIEQELKWAFETGQKNKMTEN